jgi:hypothetical protein
MPGAEILKPFFGMMLLTLAVWLYMYVRRLRYIFSEGVDAQAISTPERLARRIPEEINNASNNLKNLFELPVLFYAVCLYLLVSGTANSTDVGLAWAFLCFRIVHSAIQCMLNRVHLRSGAYLLASLALWALVLRNALAVFGQA